MAESSLRKQTAYLVVGRGIGYLVTMLSPVILVRLMTPDQVGSYRQYVFMGAVAAGVMRLCIPESLYYFFPRHAENRRALLSQTVSLLAVGGAGFSVLFVIMGEVLGWLPSGVGRNAVLPLALFFVLDTIAALMEHLFIVEKRPQIVLISSISGAVFNVLFVVGAVLTTSNVVAIVYAWILLGMIRCSFLGIYLAKRYGVRFGFPDRNLLREQIRYTLPLASSGLVGLVGVHIDKGIISASTSPEQFAIYSFGGLGIVSAVTLFSTSMGNVCLSRLSELAMRGDLGGMRALWHKMILYNAALLFPTVAFCMVFARQIIVFLYTDQYVDSTNLLRINLAMLVVMSLEYGRILVALGKTRSIFLSNLARSALGSVLAFLLIYWYGLAGGAMSAVLAYLLNAALQLSMVKRILNVSLVKLLPWRQLMMVAGANTAGGLLLWALPALPRAYAPVMVAMAPAYLLLTLVALSAVGCIQLGGFKSVMARDATPA